MTNNNLFMLVTVSLVLLIAGVLSSISANVVSQVGATFTADTIEANITVNANEGQLNLSEQYGLIGTIGGLLVVVVMLLNAFGINLQKLVRDQVGI